MEAVLLGNGAHYHRYFDSLCFQSCIESIAPYDPAVPHTADVIAVCEPLLLTQPLLSWLRGTEKSPLLLVEKLPARTLADTCAIMSALEPFRTVYVHSRLYTGAPRVLLGHDEICWPNLYHSGMDPVFHTFPNIIDFCSQQYGRMITLEDMRFHHAGGYPGFDIAAGDRRTRVRIVPAAQGSVTVNGRVLPWPNYFETYSNMLSLAFRGEINAEQNRQYLLNEMQLVEAFRDYYEVWCNEHFKHP